MVHKIVDVVGIASATDWWWDSGGNLRPLACWALVKAVDLTYPSLAPENRIIGLAGDEIGDPSLVSDDAFGRDYVHSTELRRERY